MYFRKISYNKIVQALLIACYFFFYAAQFNSEYFSLSNFYEYSHNAARANKAKVGQVAANQKAVHQIREKSSHSLHLSIDKRFQHSNLVCRTDLPYYQRTVRFALIDVARPGISEQPVTAPPFYFDFRGPPSV